MRFRPRDHPRIRGEHVPSVQADLAALGIIPAYAGSTDEFPCAVLAHRGSSPHTRGARTRPPPSARRCWDHPRIRGEHSACAMTSRSMSLDHPRIRGEHPGSALKRARGGGIIPAYAGSTARCRGPAARHRGSSPHTRGAPRAGTRPASSPRDHPRIRGEHHAQLVVHTGMDGIIPAYAGSTPDAMHKTLGWMGSSPHTRGAPPWRSRCGGSRRDHPRIRGEHCGERRYLLHVGGIIPAYAGSTWWSRHSGC